MAVRRITKTDTSFGWATGANDWGTRVNEHLKRAAYQAMHFTINDTLNMPTGLQPVEGTVYIVGDTPTGVFETFTPKNLAVLASSPPDYDTLLWQEWTPYAGWFGYHVADAVTYMFNGTDWVTLEVRPLTQAAYDALSVKNDKLLYVITG